MTGSLGGFLHGPGATIVNSNIGASADGRGPFVKVPTLDLLELLAR